MQTVTALHIIAGVGAVVVELPTTSDEELWTALRAFVGRDVTRLYAGLAIEGASQRYAVYGSASRRRERNRVATRVLGRMAPVYGDVLLCQTTPNGLTMLPLADAADLYEQCNTRQS